MNISDFVDYIQELVDKHGYRVYFGTKSNYNTKRNITNKEIILEPFDIPISNEAYYVDTTITLWIGLRQEIDTQTTNNDSGDVAKHIDKMIIEANKIYDEIKNSEKILIKQSKRFSTAQYYKSDGNATVNNQAFMRLSLPIRIYGFNY